MRDRQDRAIGLIGQGLIYQHVLSHLEVVHHIIELEQETPVHLLASCSLIVYCRDNWISKDLNSLNQRCMQANTALIPVYTQFSAGVIGPCVVPQETGCVRCAEFRKLAATGKNDERELIKHYLSGQRDMEVKQPWLTSFSLNVLAQLVAAEVAIYLREPEQIQTRHSLLYLSLDTLSCSRHRFLPLPDCPDCSTLPDDSASQAFIKLQANPKLHPLTYRTRHLAADSEELFKGYVDAEAGLIHTIRIANGWLPFVISEMDVERRNKWSTITGVGSTLRMEQNRSVAIAEALERYAGLHPRGKRTTVHASYNQLQGQALDPSTLGLHTPEQYAQMGPPAVPYSHDLILDWVWGYSFQQQRPILIPECCAYYGVSSADDKQKPLFVYEISNGCALGSSLEEAIFHGILEIAERDAFLLTWYARLSLPRIDPFSAIDPTIRMLVKHIEHHSGYTISVFNATLDHPVPCLWIMAIDEQNRADMPKVRCGAASSPHPERALYKVLCELGAGFSSARSRYLPEREHALEMLADSDKVKAMTDHDLLHFLPEAFDRLEFLYQSQQQQTFQEAFRDFYQCPPANMDLRDDLSAFIDYYLKRGIDIIVVDQTAPEHSTAGFRCVKVLMPGTLPMTFGQRNRRITGFQRLHMLPYTLGYRAHPLTEDEINPYPHPFP